eukprot:6184900-Pleurochrysis_carterae.AAC.4
MTRRNIWWTFCAEREELLNASLRVKAQRLQLTKLSLLDLWRNLARYSETARFSADPLSESCNARCRNRDREIFKCSCSGKTANAKRCRLSIPAVRRNVRNADACDTQRKWRISYMKASPSARYRKTQWCMHEVP